MEYEKKVIKKEDSPIVVILIDSDEEKSPVPSLKPKKHKQCKHKQIKATKCDDSDTLIITQKVQAKTQKIECTVNLQNICKHKKRNEEVCKHKEKKVSKSCKHKDKKLANSCKHKDKKLGKSCKSKEKKCKNKDKNESKMCKHKQIKRSNTCTHKVKDASRRCQHNKQNENVSDSKKTLENLSKDRIVPHCLRKTCELAVSQRCKKHDRKKSRKILASKNVTMSSSSNYLSPVSSDIDCLPDNEISYEKISSDSLSTFTDDELDTLIKRTKERERRLSYSSDYQQLPVPLYTSTPGYFENCFEADMSTGLGRSALYGSLHSLATLVLEHQELYSPTNPTSPMDI